MASIKDVALRAGVSSATVSRVFANKPYVREEVRTKVLQAAQELDYQPDQIAQRLRSQTTSRLVALLLSGDNTHFHAVMHGVSDLAYHHDLSLLFCNTGSSSEREKHYLDQIRSERVLGLIINPQDYQSDGRRLNALRRRGIAVILIDTDVAHVQFDLVRVDNRKGAFEAIAHLLRLGHTRVGIVAGTAGIMTASERLQGYRDALLYAGVPFDDDLVKTGDYEIDSGYRLAAEFLDRPDPPTALFVSNESMMLGTLNALAERRVRVPHDLALIGFDNAPYSAHLHAPLTVVAQPTYEVGREAVRLLLRRIAEPDAPIIDVMLPTELIVRESCGVNLAR
ncbi:MAG: LacI family DNA-binding transcriptional regulator [Chloroflexota bacterium]|nr:LacI family DNA-binding transcriptional regulator [Chloroflexota bacterium]